MSGTGDLDPRFDPAFQRGYVETGERAPAQGQGQPPRPATIGLPPEPLPPQVGDPREAVAVGVPAHPEPAAVSLEGNPWVKVLWIVASTFTILGLLVQGWSQSMNSGSFSNSDAFRSFVLPTLAYSLAPAMVQVGLAALVGVVFLHAVRWRADR